MKIRKELWFGFILMALIIAGTAVMLISAPTPPNRRRLSPRGSVAARATTNTAHTAPTAMATMTGLTTSTMPPGDGTNTTSNITAMHTTGYLCGRT